MLSESDFNDYVTDLVANGKIIIRKYAGKETLSLPNEKNTSPIYISKKSIGSDKLTAQLHEDITGIKTEFVSLRNVMITEIRDIKNLKKNYEVEVNDSLLDFNELLIRYQSEEIKFLRDEINNKNLIIKTLLKNLNDQNFSYRSDFNNFDHSFKNSKSQDEQFIKPTKTAKKKQFKDDKSNYAAPNKYESLTIEDSDVVMTSLLKHLIIVTKKIKLEATLVIIKSIIIVYLR